MSTRYVVLIKPPDDHPAFVRIVGTYRDRARAEAFCEKVRAAVEASEESWMDEATGFAYVLPIEQPRVRSAIRWALEGRD